MPKKVSKLPQTVTLSPDLIQELRQMIHQSRIQVAQAVNAGLTLLYWQIGKRVQVEILQGNRAEYGKEIVALLGQKLSQEYGRGFSDKSLRHMLRFVAVFPEFEIVSTLSRQLSWSHFKEIMYLDDELKHAFYAEICRLEGWSVRTLREKIDGQLYERTALSKKPEKLIAQELDALKNTGQVTPDLVFRDPYFLDFLGLGDAYQEKDLEAALIREMERFLLELGHGFAFVARQKRMVIDSDDYYLDLLFYHRGLRRLVAIELKLDSFKPAYKGQMELYLRWLDRYERQPGEEMPIGLILCAGKKQETVELLQMEASGIRVAEYLTELPPRELLEQKLHQVVLAARERWEVIRSPEF
ncbi:MAG: YhcG family protein [Candidatus Sericytochromatia bacterium]